MQRRRWMAVASAALASPWALGQGWPSQPVRYIVPFPPGGATDAISRALAEQLQKRLQQPVVVENLGGAGGSLGTARLRQAKPDGYTIGFGNSASHTITPHLNASVAYDPVTDFTPLSMLSEYSNVLVVGSAFPAKSMEEFLALARRKPGSLSYGSAGIGSSNHLSAALLASKAGLQMAHVPYKGSSAALVDLLGGQIDWMFAGLSEVYPFVQDKRLRILGVTSRTPDPLIPEVAPIANAVPGYEVVGFMGAFAPAGLPSPIAKRLTSEIQDILRMPDIVQRFEAQGLRVRSSSPAELSARVKRDLAAWKTVIVDAGIKPG